MVKSTINSSYVLIIPPPSARLGAGGSTSFGCLIKYTAYDLPTPAKWLNPHALKSLDSFGRNISLYIFDKYRINFIYVLDFHTFLCKAQIQFIYIFTQFILIAFTVSVIG